MIQDSPVVVEYRTFQDLIELINLDVGAHYEINNKPHFSFLRDYLAEIGTRTLLYENDYVDSDYLEDYSKHYSKCFGKYSSRCRRIHLFAKPFTQAHFQRFLTCLHRPWFLRDKGVLSEGLLSDILGYQGFIVLRPLAQTIIGRTCLRPYPMIVDGEPNRRRLYPILKRYKVHISGIALTVSSLAFQEQDKVVAKCATSAVWSALNATASLFQHHILTPVEITNSPGVMSLSTKRSIPSDGLNALQIAQVIRNVGLEPEIFEPKSLFQMFAICRAYNHCGIPLIMLSPLADIETVAGEKGSGTGMRCPISFNGGKARVRANLVGQHAMCLAGYSILEDGVPVDPTAVNPLEEIVASSSFDGDNKATSLEGRARLAAYNVCKLYAHDDQVGPFAKLSPFPNQVVIHNKSTRRDEQSEEALLTQYHRNVVGAPTRLAAIGLLIAPVDPLIRIRYPEMMELIQRINSLMVVFLHVRKQLISPSWDLMLSTSSKLRQSYVTERVLDPRERIVASRIHLPKFVWVASLSLNSHRVADLLFDATDSHLACFLVARIVFDTTRWKALTDRHGLTSPEYFNLLHSSEQPDEQLSAVLARLSEIETRIATLPSGKVVSSDAPEKEG